MIWTLYPCFPPFQLRFLAGITYAFCRKSGLQPFSQKSHTPTVPKEFQIGLYDTTGRVVRFRLVVVTTKSALVFFTPANAVTTSDWVVNIAQVSDGATSRAARSASPFASRVEVLRFLHSVCRGLARFRDAAPSSRASDVLNRSGFTSSDVDGVHREDGGPQPQCMQLTRSILKSTQCIRRAGRS